MEQLTKISTCKLVVASIMLSFMNTLALAQDSSSSSSVTKSSSSTTTTETIWYTEPWVWVLGAAILIIIIIALTRTGGTTTERRAGHTDKVTYTKKVSKEDNP
jgi:hypothetical protein